MALAGAPSETSVVRGTWSLMYCWMLRFTGGLGCKDEMEMWVEGDRYEIQERRGKRGNDEEGGGGVRGNGVERKIQSCQETVTDAAVGDAEERTAGRRAGVSRSALHLNAGLDLAGEEQQNCWMNTEKLSLSLCAPPSEPCELLEASPEMLQLLLLLTDGPSLDERRRPQPHAAKSTPFRDADLLPVLTGSTLLWI